jgi:hypothetical protein
MAGEQSFWARVSGEVRQASRRTKSEARRAVRMGVLGVDLVSLRHDRTRAHANLGERVVKLWSAADPGAIQSDSEALRLRALVESLEASIRAKEDELNRLRAEPAREPGFSGPQTSQPESPAAHETSAP